MEVRLIFVIANVYLVVFVTTHNLASLSTNRGR